MSLTPIDELDSVDDAALAAANGASAAAAAAQQAIDDLVAVVNDPATGLAFTKGVADAALTAANAAQTTANGAAQKAANGSDFTNVTTLRVNVGAMRKVTRYGFPTGWTYMSNRPFPLGPTSTTTISASGRLLFVPYASDSTWTIDQLAIELTTAASAATYTAQFALYNVGVDGRPSTLAQDLSSLGLLNLVTGGPGFPTLAFPSQIFPAGEFFLAALFLGTAIVTNPVIRSVSGSHPSVGYSSPTLLSGGYLQGSLAAMPASATPSFVAGLMGPAFWARSA